MCLTPSCCFLYGPEALPVRALARRSPHVCPPAGAVVFLQASAHVFILSTCAQGCHPHLLPGPHHGFPSPLQPCSVPPPLVILPRAVRGSFSINQTAVPAIAVGSGLTLPPSSCSSHSHYSPFLQQPHSSSAQPLCTRPLVWNTLASACHSDLQSARCLCAVLPTMLCHAWASFLPGTCTSEVAD